MFEDPDKRKKNLKYSINIFFTRLQEKGFVEVIEINGKKVAKLTKKGEAQIGFLEKHNFKIKKPKRWDGRWTTILNYRTKKENKIYFTPDSATNWFCKTSTKCLGIPL